MCCCALQVTNGLAQIKEAYDEAPHFVSRVIQLHRLREVREKLSPIMPVVNDVSCEFVHSRPPPALMIVPTTRVESCDFS